MQVEDQASQASAHRVKRLAQEVQQRDSDTGARGASTNQRQTEKPINYEELGFIDRGNVAEDSALYGLNQGYVTDVAIMSSSDDLVQSKCAMMLNG